MCTKMHGHKDMLMYAHACMHTHMHAVSKWQLTSCVFIEVFLPQYPHQTKHSNRTHKNNMILKLSPLNI